MAVTRDLVLLPADWPERSDLEQAALLLHELTHIRQWRTYLGFGLRWSASPRFRVAMETQAYRESVATYAMAGLSAGSIAEYARRRSDSFPERYRTESVNVEMYPYLLDSIHEVLLGLGVGRSV